MRFIYLSPHLDDAILTAGGLIHDQARPGQAVEVWTFMCGIPSNHELSDFAREIHGKWGTTTAEQTVATRRAEDAQAAGIVGATPVHFDFLDAIYRRGRDGSPLYAEPVRAGRHAEDAELPAKMARSASARLKPDDVVVCPLAVGEHVDHVIVRQAAEMLGRPLLYAVDLPYLFYEGGQHESKTAGMHSELYPVSAEGVAAWLQAIPAYASQLTTLYESWDGLRAAIREYWSREHGIRLWSFDDGGARKGLDSASNS